MRETTFEVHYWPTTGRILVIHIPNFGVSADIPILTELHVTGEHNSPDLRDATYLMALAVSDAGNPSGGLVEHRADGTVTVNRDQSGVWRDLTPL